MEDNQEGELVNLVQQIAKSNHGQPYSTRYVVREEDRPDVDPPVGSDVPVIDVSRLFRSDDHGLDEAEKLRSALQSWGLFQAIGHDMPLSLLEEVRDIAKSFFKLPIEIKQKYSNLRDGYAFKFEGYGTDHVATEDQVVDWNDRLFLLVQPEDQRKFKLWPENPNSFRDVLHEYTIRARKFVEQILFAMAKLLGLDDMYFINQLHEGDVYARFNYYPTCSRPDLILGVKSHCDGSFITLLLPDKDVEGLQVLKDDQWLKVPIIPHALVVNLGNQMEIMCNGIFKSPVHRVVVSATERVSLVMFYMLQQEKDLEPAEGMVNKTRPRLYKKMKVKDFSEAYFYYSSQGKDALDWVKV